MSQSGLVDVFENQVLPNLQLFHIPDRYMEEIEGMHKGFVSRGGGSVYSELLERKVTLDDAIALNCINALASRTGCRSFSAWDDVTHDGATITAYDHDTIDDERYTGRWLLIVRRPSAGLGSYATICAGRAGDMNVHTVMNENGVTLSCQTINDANPATSTNFWLRRPPVSPCDRFLHVQSSLDSISAGTKTPLTVESVWNLLSEIHPEDSYLTQIAAVFEPSKKRMHIAVAEPGRHAHSCRRITANIEDLFLE